jgi:hypothetical protein
LDPTGLLNDILASANNIDAGRKALDTDGMEHEGRLFYRDGIATAMSSFQEVQISKDPKTIVLSESAFLTQEFQFCAESDTITRNSLTEAIKSFRCALRSLEAVENPGYRIAEKTYSLKQESRIKGLPKDAFHQACIAHRTRIGNILRSPGINMIEKAVLKQRQSNMRTAQESYIEKQMAILEQ